MEEFSELKSARLLSIYARLLNRRVLKKALLAQEFGVTARSIQRDLESLRSFLSNEMLPQDVVYDRAAGGCRLTHARPNEKWLTDVIEFKWYEGNKIHKLYLSAILDLCDRRIVSYVLGEHNNNPLVFKTFDKAVLANPDAHPLFHSDRGFQYTNRTFHHKLVQAGMTQSMSRVAHCIDNGPMEGFWGILKRERYYGRRFTSKHELVQMIQQYIRYYNTRRVQRNLGLLTPMEKHELCSAA